MKVSNGLVDSLTFLSLVYLVVMVIILSVYYFTGR